MEQTVLCDDQRGARKSEQYNFNTTHLRQTHDERDDSGWNEMKESCLDRCDVELGMKEKRQEQASSFSNWPQIAFCWPKTRIIEYARWKMNGKP